MPSKDISTFDGAEFSGEKPKSDEGIIKIMEMLNIPQKSRVGILNEEKKLDKQRASVKEPPTKKMKIIPLLDTSKQMPKQSPDEV